MVSKAVTEGLITRIQYYVATDINSKHAKGSGEPKIRPEDVFVLRFNRILNSWEALATCPLRPEIYYEIVHEGVSGTSLVNIYQKRSTQPAIL